MTTDRPVLTKDATRDKVENKEHEGSRHLAGEFARSPRQSLDHIQQMRQDQQKQGTPKEFGQLQLVSGPSSRERMERDLAEEMKEPKLPDTVRSEGTRIKSTGNASPTNVKIEYGENGKPHALKDQHGHWKSDDGGQTWKSGEPKFATRRGEVSIDKQGNYNFENTDYGLKSQHAPDGTSKRSITAADGTQYSVTRDQKGMPTGFKDKTGEWSSKDGRNWENNETKEKKSGRVSLSEYGEYKFDKTVAQSPQLERINKMQEALTKKYGVTFAKPGEVQGGEEQTDGSASPAQTRALARPQPGSERKAGVPTEAELKTLGNILDKTKHENYKGMKVWFMQHGNYSPQEMASYTGNDRQGGPGHQHAGDCCSQNRGPGGQKNIERMSNGDLVVNAPARQVTKGFDTFERTGLHELSHHEQRSSLGKMQPNADMVGPGSSPESRKMAAEMGWKWSQHANAPAMQDKQGGLWVLKQPQDKPPYWTPDGAPNSPNSKERRKRIDDLDMRERAAIKPVTPYFTNPHEMHAEGLTQFRVGERDQFRGGRRQLAQESPQLYDSIKRYDQGVLDRKYGKNADGSSRAIRDIDGSVIPATQAARERVMQRERFWRSSRGD
ncbi:MAG: hypothetical protein J0H83_15225 [Candidatus Melainabacteria bacterium]|nr:hypothetical protein [Candidatus Melainabacteria bacterium]